MGDEMDVLLSRLTAVVIVAFVTAGGLTLIRGQTPAAAQEQGFTFGLMGDLGYFPEHEPWVDNVFADLNKDTTLAFVVHVGDLSRPVFACADDFLARRLV